MPKTNNELTQIKEEIYNILKSKGLTIKEAVFLLHGVNSMVIDSVKKQREAIDNMIIE